MLRVVRFLFIPLAVICADTLVLKDGSSISGTWAGADSSQVSILSEGLLKKYPRAEVSTVTFGPPQAAPAVETPGTPTAQQKLPEPEYVGQFCVLDAGGTLRPIEHQTAHIETKAKALGLGGIASYYLISGERSPERIPEGVDVAFVVRLKSRDFDPSTIVQFFRLREKNGQRQLPMPQIGRDNGTEVPFSAAKYGNSSFVIRPKSSLAPGEYALSLTTSNVDGYFFGVDNAAK